MSVFRFKKFEVMNEKSAMKVNTDGVLLGAAMTLMPSDRSILDVGTGTGTIALMAAQRLADLAEGQADVLAIDIDEDSSQEAGVNFRNSPWKDRLKVLRLSLDELDGSMDSQLCFDMIFSNPPYFDESLQAPELRRNNARHTSTGLSYRELLEFASRRLSPDGRISMVLPSDTETDLMRHARMNGLHPFRILRVRTVERKNPVRIIAEFSRSRCTDPEIETLTINKEGKYSDEYLSLTRDFYLFA